MTAPDNYGQNIALWQMTDAPSIPAAIAALADGVIPRSVMRFASASTRAATLVGGYAPVEGMLSWLQDTNRLYMYDGSAWVELSRALTTEWVEDTTNRTVSTNTFGNGSFALSTAITAPPSSWVEVTFGVRCDNTAGANTLSSFEATGSVTGSIRTPSDTRGTQWADTTSAGPFSATHLMSCIPGETVTVTLKHRVVSGTGNLRYRYLTLRQI